MSSSERGVAALRFEAFEPEAFAPLPAAAPLAGAAAAGARAWLPDAIADAPAARVATPLAAGLVAADAPFAGLLPDFGAPWDEHAPAAAVPAGPTAEELEAARQQAEFEAAFEAAVAEQVAQAMAQREAEEAARLEEVRAAALAEGEAAGRAACEQEVLEALGSAYAALHEAAQAVQAQGERWTANLEENVAALAVGVARHVVGREVAADPAVVRALAARAVLEFPVDQPLTVRAHPDDLAALRATLGDAAADARDLRWTADANLARGGVLVEGRERIVDGRVDAALERVYRALARTNA